MCVQIGYLFSYGFFWLPDLILLITLKNGIFKHFTTEAKGQLWNILTKTISTYKMEDLELRLSSSDFKKHVLSSIIKCLLKIACWGWIELLNPPAFEHNLSMFFSKAVF